MKIEIFKYMYILSWAGDNAMLEGEWEILLICFRLPPQGKPAMDVGKVILSFFKLNKRGGHISR